MLSTIIAGLAFATLLVFLYMNDERQRRPNDTEPMQMMDLGVPPMDTIDMQPTISLDSQIGDWQARARNLLVKEEGISLTAYPDGRGYAICYGHHDEVTKRDTATLAECERDFNIDFNHAETVARMTFPQFDSHPASVKAALVDMAFLLGAEGLVKFSDTIQAVDRRDYGAAAEAVRDSLAESQIPHRIDDIAELFLEGVQT